MLLPESVTRISTCEIEADVMAADITNRRTVSGTYCSKPHTVEYESKVLSSPHMHLTKIVYVALGYSSLYSTARIYIALQPVNTCFML
jgi:hypothetical protein